MVDREYLIEGLGDNFRINWEVSKYYPGDRIHRRRILSLFKTLLKNVFFKKFASPFTLAQFYFSLHLEVRSPDPAGKSLLGERT